MSAIANPLPLDVFTCPLDGVRLVEASAGTGKTWNICGLYLRLLLERELAVESVLVVTFTKAATAELSSRIRERIVDCLRVLDGGDPGADPFVPGLIACAGAAGIEPPLMAERLRRALQTFDEAAIFTIHGFCQRALADTPFAAGLPYALELAEDDGALRREVAQDFWRREIAAGALAPLLADHLLACGDSPEGWAEMLRRDLARPLAERRWDEAEAADLAALHAALEAAYADAVARWGDGQGPCEAVSGALDALNKSSYKPDALARARRQWQDWLGAGDPRRALPGDKDSKLHLLCEQFLAGKVKKGGSAPTGLFFAAADALLGARGAVDAAVDAARLQLLRRFLAEGAEELRRRKRERRQIAFDDILWNAYAALTSGAQPWLAGALHQRYPAALIDEFQDTDPLQFAIFDRVYNAEGRHGSLFLVGDPKQAIYSFRSADLHTYLAARDRADACYTLATNQRSSAALIDACNRLFSANPAVFMLDGLDYRKVGAGTRPRPPLFDAADDNPAALRLWRIPKDEALEAAAEEEGGDGGGGGHRLPREQALQRAARASAAEIARLLAAGAAGEVRIGERPLAPADIAVLVRSHGQGARMRRALAAFGVGSVELSQASVFHTEDAEELERVLIAIAEPAREARVMAALATAAMGYGAAAIAALAADEAALLRVLDRFAGWREIWLARGFGVMLRRWMSDEGVAARLLARADGERRLTNLMHLAELLQQAAGTASPEVLLRTLATRRAEEGGEAAQLRLESDRNLVQIVTIHRSKGLEYGIVFCPFLFDGYPPPAERGPMRAWHADDGTLVLDYRSEAAADKTIAARIRAERMAEDMRLAYVALTRAVHRCYLVVGCYARMAFGKPGYSESGRSLLNWMAAGAGLDPEAWAEHKMTPAEIDARWRGLVTTSGGVISLADLPAGEGEALAQDDGAERVPRVPRPPQVSAGWRIGSFSALIFGATHEQAARDHDARQVPVEPESPPAPPPAADDILRFPRGPVAGDCLHAVFERIDFTDPGGWDAAIESALADHPQRGEADGARLHAMLRSMLRDVLDAPLTAGPAPLRLGTLTMARRLTELGFHLPAPRVEAEALNAWLAARGYGVPRLAFTGLEGYLKGFIDLVFEHDGRYWVLDWKSNHLGNAPADYAPARLEAAMQAHGYHLQHLLYTVALHRHLGRCVPDYDYARHFGGVLYLFVRGVRPGWQADGQPAGVFHHRPEVEVVQALDHLLAGGTRAPLAEEGAVQ
ncbi:exodeoxyribonuclease V subunit beta [Azoarcus olearius]|uniref:RecBCD enzyme subunit RecB n=1 Tax=Azoarcus sp. (strain BH72) TaxID=418699 RepID=A1KCB1_AZOSB|nr:exodeoxyribonuclease V subunit beta [Azoarcus olearius]CAL96467.1 ATP-dependent exoDNAse beta subunit [Azoarcus olearius]